MTYPVTPNPAVHDGGDTSYVKSSGLANSTQIKTWANSLVAAMNMKLATTIITALGGLVPSGEAGTAEEALANLFGALETSLADIPSGNITGLEAALSQAESDWNTLLSAFGVGSVPSLATVLQNIQTAADNANTNITDFLKTGDWSDLSAAFSDFWQALIGGTTTVGVLSTVPAPAVVSTDTSAQPFANFPNAASVNAGSGWAYDATVSFGGSGGSVTYAASGVLGVLRGVVAPVQAGQTATLAAQVQWSGLAAASGTTPIRLQLVPGYVAPGATSFTPGAAVALDSVAAGPSSSSWTPLSGAYVVPSDGSVNAVQMQLVVTADATAGSVTWAACTDTISGGFLPTLQSDLSALQSDSAASTAAFSALVTSVQAAITGATSWSGFMTAVDSAWSTYSTTQAQIDASESFTIQGFFEFLLGFSPAGQVPQTSIESTTGGGSLANDIRQAQYAWLSLFGAAPTTETQTISQDVVSGLTDAWDWLTGSAVPPTTAGGANPAAAVSAGVLPNITPGTGPGQSSVLASVQSNLNAIGSGIKVARENTASASVPTSSGMALMDSGFFETVIDSSSGYSAAPLTYNGTTFQAVQVQSSGRYIVGLRYKVAAASTGAGQVSIAAGVQRFTSAGAAVSGADDGLHIFGSGAAFTNGFGGQYNAAWIGGTGLVAANAGDYLVPGYYIGTLFGAINSLSFTGEATGTESYFQVVLANMTLEGA